MNNTSIQFINWFATFIEEKNLNTEEIFEVVNDDPDSLFGNDFVRFNVVVEFVNNSDSTVHRNVKEMLVKIDSANANVMDFFAHMAKGVVMASMIEG